MSCSERGSHDSQRTACITVTVRQTASHKQVGCVFAAQRPQGNVIGTILMDHPPDCRLPWFGVILNRPRSQAHHIVEALSVLDILCRDLIACIHVTGLACADFWSRCQDVGMLTTGYSAKGLQIGPGLFSPMDFCCSQTFCVSAVVFLINEVGCHIVCNRNAEE